MKTLLFPALAFLAVLARGAEDAPPPVVKDARLALTLVASDPGIVTPAGAAADARGRLFVIESHTHLAPADYAGPKRDRIKVFAEGAKPSVFADDLNQAMGLGFAPDGTLFVCTSKEVIALHDRDGDGVSEARSTVLTLETQQSYPHSCLLAIVFSPEGWLHVSRGNTGGLEYAYRAADGTALSGYGDGGDIVRMRADGSGLERVATGFWNAFGLGFDAHGRLLAVDNDPDSRGPNRLLHIVPGGNYGYRTLYGPSGLHPYQAWEGELPGTLPMIAGIGEAPCAVLDAGTAALPAEYRGALLATVWGEHAVTVFRPKPAGVSLTAPPGEVLVLGGENFRPVALAPAPDGSVFITDWVLHDYPNHGRGRIWKLSAKPGIEVSKPRPILEKAEPLPEFAHFERVLASVRADDHDALLRAVSDADPFIRSAAATALARPVFRDAVMRDLEAGDAAVRLGALLALRQADIAGPEPLLRKLLGDPDADIRQMALVWTGERVLEALRPDIDRAVSGEAISMRLFDTWLATVQILDSDAAAAYRKKIAGAKINRDLSAGFIEELVRDASRPSAVRALALARLKNPDAAAVHSVLLALAAAGPAPLRIEAVRSLAASTKADAGETVLAIALDPDEPPVLRAEAALAMMSLDPQRLPRLLPLLDDADESLRVQAARALRLSAGDPDVRAAMEKKLAALRDDPALRQQLGHALRGPAPDRPATLEAWQSALATGGDAAAGQRVFYSPQTGCSSCHEIAGRGARAGPRLTAIARTSGRARLIHSILRPSDEIAPQFQGWTIETKDGDIVTGLQGHRRANGVTIELLDGTAKSVPNAQIESFGAMEQSLMPPGLEAAMTIEEFRDLFAYLESLR